MLSLWRDAASGVGVVRLTEAEEIEEMVRLFEDVAGEQGWQPAGALRQWVDRSIYFALQVQGDEGPGGPGEPGQFAGGLQLVLADAGGLLPCHALWPEVPAGAKEGSKGRSAHVAMLAVDTAYRGQGILFWHLAVEMWRHCVGAGVTTLWIEVTPRVLPLYRRLGWPLTIRGQVRRHWGEDCYLCTLGIPDVAQALLQRAEGSPYYRQIVAQAFRVTLAARGDWPTMGAETERCAA